MGADWKKTPTYVKEVASIGANATIVCGITLGAHSLIAAGAVVTKDVKDYALMVGNPAKHVGWVTEYGEKIALVADDDSASGSWTDSRGSIYTLSRGLVAKTSEAKKGDEIVKVAFLGFGEIGSSYARIYESSWYTHPRSTTDSFLTSQTH